MMLSSWATPQIGLLVSLLLSCSRALDARGVATVSVVIEFTGDYADSNFNIVMRDLKGFAGSLFGRHPPEVGCLIGGDGMCHVEYTAQPDSSRLSVIDRNAHTMKLIYIIKHDQVDDHELARVMRGLFNDVQVFGDILLLVFGDAERTVGPRDQVAGFQADSITVRPGRMAGGEDGGGEGEGKDDGKTYSSADASTLSMLAIAGLLASILLLT